MGDSADVPGATPAVSDATRLRAGDCVRVYRATLADAGQRVRLFVLAPDTPAPAAAAFERAATAWERCSQFRGIVPVLARGDTPRPWVAVADVDGRRLPETDLPLSATRHVLADVAEGLRSAHREGCYHRGLTPSHIWVVTDGTGETTGFAGRLDWGLERACLLALGDLPAPCTPPELRRDADVAGAPARADVYGLGAVAAATIAGSEALPAPTVSGRAVPNGVDDVLPRALAADPADRYQSVYAFKRALLFEAGHDTPGDPGSEAGTSATGHGTDTPATRPVTSSAERAERDDGPAAGDRPFVRRRAVLGALGVGAAGTVTAGGAWLFGAGATDDGADDGGVNADVPDVTDTGRRIPNAQFEFVLQPLSVAVIYQGGDRIPAGELSVRSDALYGEERVWSAATDTDPGRPVRPGETFQFDVEPRRRACTNGRCQAQEGETAQIAVDGAYDVRVVWDREDAVLASVRGPVDPQDPALGDVTTVQYDLGNTGSTRATAPAPSARRRWRFETDGRVESSPAVVDGVVYFGSNDGSVYAVDAVTGTELWSVRLGSRVWASPTVARFPGSTDAGRAATSVFVGNTDGTFHSLDARDGSTRWRSVVGREYISAPGVVSLADDEGPVEAPVVLAGGSDRLSAFNAREGIELWRFEAGQYVSGPGILPPRDDSDRDRTTVVVASSNNTVYALDAHDGHELWASTVEGVATPPTVARPSDTPQGRPGYTVFLGTGLAEPRGISALAAGDGSQRWQVGTESDVVSSPAVVDGTMAVAAGGTVFAGDSGGTVYAVNARDGSLRWSAETDDPITSAPIVVDTSGTEWSDGAGNTLYLGSWDGNVYGFETDSGNARWVFHTAAAVGCSPTVADGTLYIGNHEGQMYAVGER